MNWRVATPTLSVASGQYSTSQSVTVTIADPDATLRYTTTGVDPTSSAPTVTSGNAIAVNASLTLKVSGWKTGAPTSVVVARAYELKAVTPTLSPGTGSYGSSQSVSMSTTTSDAGKSASRMSPRTNLARGATAAARSMSLALASIPV